MRAGVVGLGVVGRQELELWLQGADAVVGYDREVGVLDTLRAHAGRAELTNEPAALRNADVIIVCLPTATPEGLPSLAAFDAFASVYSPPPEQLIVVASTVSIGFCRRFAERIATTHVAHAPERFDPGRRLDLAAIPRVVGGLTQAAAATAEGYYLSLGVSVTRVSSLEVAEATKLLENSFRLVNVAFINEFAELCRRLGVSTAEIVAAAGTKPFGFMPHTPGAGAGGTCIPVVPRFLTHIAAEQGASMPILSSALQSNDDVPARVLQRAVALGARRILVVGGTYKPNHSDSRGSAALRIVQTLSERFDVVVVDPFLDAAALPRGVRLASSTSLTSPFDLVIIAVMHDNVDRERLLRMAPHCVDLTRGEEIPAARPPVPSSAS